MLYNIENTGFRSVEMDRYRGKRISILGDSISTFTSYIPDADGVNLAHRARYPQDNLLTNVNDTWWMKVINTLGASLGINDSWAGSTVSNSIDGNERDFGVDAAMASLTRIRNLGANGTPDIIFFFGGTNDAGKMVKKGSFDGNFTPDLAAVKWDSFAEAYCEALCRLKYFYPNAELISLTPSFSNGYYDNSRLSEFADLIIEICSHYKVKCIDLRLSGIAFDMLPDGLHPNADGMDCIYKSVINILKEE